MDRGSLADDLGDRPEGDSLPVREATPVQNARVDAQAQLGLGDKARLANPRLANEGQEPAATLGARLVESRFQPAELLFAANEWGRSRSRSRRRGDVAEAINRKRLRLAFRVERWSCSASTASPTSR